jgi:uncharacterized protein YeeX (DUF496 family)
VVVEVEVVLVDHRLEHLEVQVVEHLEVRALQELEVREIHLLQIRLKDNQVVLLLLLNLEDQVVVEQLLLEQINKMTIPLMHQEEQEHQIQLLDQM